MRTRLITLFLAILLLGGCVSATAIPDRYLAGPEEAAYLVGSIALQTAGRDRSQNSINSILFRQIGAEEMARLTASQNPFVKEEVDFKTNQKRGRVFSLPLVPGRYEIANVFFAYSTAYVRKTFTAEEVFSIPFEVEAGKVYYVGEFLARGIFGRTLFGAPTSDGGYFLRNLDDRIKKRDWDVLKQKYPELEGKEIVELDLAEAPPFIYSLIP